MNYDLIKFLKNIFTPFRVQFFLPAKSTTLLDIFLVAVWYFTKRLPRLKSFHSQTSRSIWNSKSAILRKTFFFSKLSQGRRSNIKLMIFYYIHSFNIFANNFVIITNEWQVPVKDTFQLLIMLG